MDDGFEPTELQDPGDYDVELRTRRATMTVATIASGAVIIQAISKIWTVPPVLLGALFVLLIAVSIVAWRRPGALARGVADSEPRGAEPERLDSANEEEREEPEA